MKVRPERYSVSPQRRSAFTTAAGLNDWPNHCKLIFQPGAALISASRNEATTGWAENVFSRGMNWTFFCDAQR